MTTEQRIIRKNLAGAEDIMLGKGKVTQARNGSDYEISRINVVKLFDSVAEMVADTSLTVGQTVETLGYHSLGDGGGNIYSIKTAGTGTEDLGEFINLVTNQAKGLFLAGPNLKQFGAIVGGTSAALTAALAVFDQLHVPVGLYLIDSDYTIASTKVLTLEVGAVLKPEAGTTLTISGSVIAPAVKIFDSGAGTLIGPVQSIVEAAWFEATPTYQLDIDNATPSVQTGHLFTTANTAATTITNLLQGNKGQAVTIIINDVNTTVDFTGSNLKGNVGADWTPTVGDHMTCVFDGSNWYCTVSDNTV